MCEVTPVEEGMIGRLLRRRILREEHVLRKLFGQSPSPEFAFAAKIIQRGSLATAHHRECTLNKAHEIRVRARLPS